MDKLPRVTIVLLCGALSIYLSIVVWSYIKHTQAKKYSIGLVWVPSRAFQEQLGTNFMRTIKHDKRFILKEFSAPSTADLIALNAICEAALDTDTDIFLTIGFNCAKTLSQLSKKRKSPKPIVMCGVFEPAARDVVDSLERPGGSTTGIYDAGPYTIIHPIDILLALKPEAKSILMPYVVTAHDNENHVYNAKRIALSHGVQVTPLPINKAEDALDLIGAIISNYDSIIYLEGDSLSPYGGGIGKLASQHGVTLFASSPDADGTAAFTYYVEFAYIAQQAYAMIQKIIFNKEDPATTPVKQLTSSRILTINTNCCAQQGMSHVNIRETIKSIQTNSYFDILHNRIKVV